MLPLSDQFFAGFTLPCPFPLRKKALPQPYCRLMPWATPTEAKNISGSKPARLNYLQKRGFLFGIPLAFWVGLQPCAA
jgi:hypothetical protein